LALADAQVEMCALAKATQQVTAMALKRLRRLQFWGCVASRVRPTLVSRRAAAARTGRGRCTRVATICCVP